ALTFALQQGRNGKGCVVVFSSGNNAGLIPYVNYPANFHPDILTVGAINENGQRWIVSVSAGSGFGPELDVVAPGVEITSSVIEYPQFKKASGTSMAAPHRSEERRVGKDRRSG